jgi:DNA-binding NarL/FixJ family response regulator
MEGGENHQMAGLELLNALRDRGITTPVIIYAGARGVSRRQELEQAGARLVTQKPSEVFDEAVRTVTSG